MLPLIGIQISVTCTRGTHTYEVSRACSFVASILLDGLGIVSFGDGMWYNSC